MNTQTIVSAISFWVHFVVVIFLASMVLGAILAIYHYRRNKRRERRCPRCDEEKNIKRLPTIYGVVDDSFDSADQAKQGWIQRLKNQGWALCQTYMFKHCLRCNYWGLDKSDDKAFTRDQLERRWKKEPHVFEHRPHFFRNCGLVSPFPEDNPPKWVPPRFEPSRLTHGEKAQINLPKRWVFVITRDDLNQALK